ncbi:MAG TPA: single-stranded DNA-binding protein [Planctomycetota bacterium]|nr:single-stranded DNA-binding protein [Planctomycetota bacterium]
MANFNKVILAGNITRDPQVRYTPNGTAVAEFGLAINRQWKGPDGETKEDVCFVDVQAWSRTGEVITDHLGKGDPILIEGRLQMQSWQGQDGQKRTKHIVVVESFQFIGRRSSTDQSGQPRPPRPPRQPRQGQPPSQPAPQQNPAPSQDAPADSFGGEDIPF